MCKRELTEAELAQVNGGGTYNNGLNNWYEAGIQGALLGWGTGMPTGDVAMFLQGQQDQQRTIVQGDVSNPFSAHGRQL